MCIPCDETIHGPQSLFNRSFSGVFVLFRCFLDFSVGVGAFVIGLSQISFFLVRHDYCHSPGVLLLSSSVDKNLNLGHNF